MAVNENIYNNSLLKFKAKTPLEAQTEQQTLEQQITKTQSGKMELQEARQMQAADDEIRQIVQRHVRIGPDGAPIVDESTLEKSIGEAAQRGNRRALEIYEKHEATKAQNAARTASAQNLEAKADEDAIAGVYQALQSINTDDPAAEPYNQQAWANVQAILKQRPNIAPRIPPAALGAYSREAAKIARQGTMNIGTQTDNDTAAANLNLAKKNSVLIDEQRRWTREEHEQKQAEGARKYAIDAQNDAIAAVTRHPLVQGHLLARQAANKAVSFEEYIDPATGKWRKNVDPEQIAAISGDMRYLYANIRDPKGVVMTADYLAQFEGRSIAQSFESGMAKVLRGDQLNEAERKNILYLAKKYGSAQLEDVGKLLKNAALNLAQVPGADPGVLADAIPGVDGRAYGLPERKNLTFDGQSLSQPAASAAYEPTDAEVGEYILEHNKEFAEGKRRRKLTDADKPQIRLALKKLKEKNSGR